METEWVFLQPWLDALRSSLVHHNDNDNDNDDDQAQVIQAVLDCWPESLDEYSVDDPDFTVERWRLFVDFPADDASRQERGKLQRVREAMELFNMLAVVDNNAFKSLLSDFVGAVQSTCIIHPVWECSLGGTLSIEDPIAKQPKVTWGAIFGCPDDPWEYSPKFRDAMLKLEAMDKESGEGEEEEGDSYGGEIDSSLNWYLQHEAVPMNGVQETKSYSASKSTCEKLSRKLGELFGLDVPPMVHVCAVQDSASVVKSWRQLDADVVSLDTIEIYPTFVGSGVPELTAALARTKTMTLQLSLRDEQIPQHERELSIENAGFMFSSVFCGRSNL